MNDKQTRLNPLQVVLSILAAFFGVQSEANRERDFSRGRPWQFIVAGVVMTALFIIIVLTVVGMVVD